MGAIVRIRDGLYRSASKSNPPIFLPLVVKAQYGKFGLVQLLVNKNMVDGFTHLRLF